MVTTAAIAPSIPLTIPTISPAFRLLPFLASPEPGEVPAVDDGLLEPVWGLVPVDTELDEGSTVEELAPPPIWDRQLAEVTDAHLNRHFEPAHWPHDC
jgi:hypothetical protein